MRIKITLRYAREPELVALRYDPSIYFPGLIKEALRSYVNNQEFKIKISEKINYEKRPLSCYLTLDDETDKDIIDILKLIRVPRTTFIRNIVMHSITGNVDYIYQNQLLKQLSEQKNIEKNTNKEIEKKLEINNTPITEKNKSWGDFLSENLFSQDNRK